MEQKILTNQYDGKYDPETETLDDLQLNGLHLVQYKDGFRFGMDAVLLANFAAADINGSVNSRKARKILDIGTGTGIIPVLMSGKTVGTEFEAVDIQERYAELAARNFEMNNLGERAKSVNAGIDRAKELWNCETFDVIVSNPPYMIAGRGMKNEDESKTIARHEVKCTIDDIMNAAYYLLKDKGSFYLVHRPGRLADIFEAMRLHRIEPKIMHMVQSTALSKPEMVLIKAVKNGGRELRVEPPVILYDEKGSLKETHWFD